MRIIVEQTGGFVGYLRHEVDSKDLNEGQQEKLMQLLNNCRARTSLSKGNDHHGNIPGSQITIETEEGSNTIVISPGQKDKDTASLLRFVRQLGKPRPLL